MHDSLNGKSLEKKKTVPSNKNKRRNKRIKSLPFSLSYIFALQCVDLRYFKMWILLDHIIQV